MGAVKIVNLKAERGDSLTRSITFKDSDGDPINITGWTIYFTIKEKEDDSDDVAKIKKDITAHLNAPGGETKVSVLASVLNELVGKYYYDYQFKKAGGEIKTIIKGTYTFGKDITRRVT